MSEHKWVSTNRWIGEEESPAWARAYDSVAAEAICDLHNRTVDDLQSRLRGALEEIAEAVVKSSNPLARAMRDIARAALAAAGDGEE